MQIALTSRQQEILRRVTAEHIATGQPVGSKSLASSGDMGVSSSTIRSEFAELESLGVLTHPHTSAGRVPTALGYRLYAERILESLEPRPSSFPLDLGTPRVEVDAALRATTEMLAEVTRLLALVSAQALETSTIRHVEVLLLQPSVVMVVVITSAGDVTKRAFTFDEPIDVGLATWARESLTARLAGVQLGTRLLRQRLLAPELGSRERAFLQTMSPAFTELDPPDQRVFVGGTAGLLADARADELAACRRLLEMLERRAALLELVGDTLQLHRPFVRVGDASVPALEHVSVVGARYGVGHRALGAVSLLGPLRMDYDKAIRSVRAAAVELSRFVEEVYTDN